MARPHARRLLHGWALVLILLWALGGPTPVSAQGSLLKFDHLTVDQGLSHNNVYAIVQDRRGFLWFGTEDGLNRYDGYTVEVFTHDPQDSTSLSHNWIWSLYEDHAGTLWVGTYGGGLCRFDRPTETFTCYRHDPDDPGSLPDDIVPALAEDAEGTDAELIFQCPDGWRSIQRLCIEVMSIVDSQFVQITRYLRLPMIGR